MSSIIQLAGSVDPGQRYTIDEAARILRISRARLYTKAKVGELRLIKDGRRSYIGGSELIAQASPQPA